MVEQAFKDLPKHLESASEIAALVGRDLVDRFWAMKAEVDRRIEAMSKNSEDTSKNNKNELQQQVIY